MKPESVFQLENAGWPVLLVEDSVRVKRANLTARRLFGLEAEPENVPLSAIWSPQNPFTAEKFLDQWERSPMAASRLKFRTRTGEIMACPALVCAFFQAGQRLFLLQLLPDMPPGEDKPPSGDINLAQKQKLECALQLARTVALDFNNALTSILGHTSLVLTKIEPDHPWRGSLLEIEKSAARAAEIANDLGTFSQHEKEPRTQTGANLNLVLQRTVDVFRRHASAAKVEWKVALERRIFGARFDEAKMQQAFAKIVENALEALNGPGRITIQVRNLELTEGSQDRAVRLPPGSYVSVEVSDTGCGIPSEVLPRIFEPFFTTKGGPHRGVGLAWVYGIVTNHGGGVAVSSQPGIGTSVRVYLPAEGHVLHDDETQLRDLRGTQKILVVDDEDLVLTMAEKVLSTYGYRVVTANSGQKALELLSKEHEVALVITDLVMPSMSGRELVERIHAQNPQLRVLCTSGYVWQGRQHEDLQYLRKPFTAQELLLKVKQALNI